MNNIWIFWYIAWVGDDWLIDWLIDQLADLLTLRYFPCFDLSLHHMTCLLNGYIHECSCSILSGLFFSKEKFESGFMSNIGLVLNWHYCFVLINRGNDWTRLELKYKWKQYSCIYICQMFDCEVYVTRTWCCVSTFSRE